MTEAGQRFPFVMRKPELGSASLLPMLPLTLAGTKNPGTGQLVLGV